jgi:uncharacterized protein
MTDFLKEEENKIVFSALKDIEEKYNVKVIFAVEAGSKSFGLESENSDFDVRGFYVHKDTDWYLSIEENPIYEIVMKDDDKLDIKLTEFRKVRKCQSFTHTRHSDCLDQRIFQF